MFSRKYTPKQKAEAAQMLDSIADKVEDALEAVITVIANVDSAADTYIERLREYAATYREQAKSEGVADAPVQNTFSDTDREQKIAFVADHISSTGITPNAWANSDYTKHISDASLDRIYKAFGGK